MKKIEVDEQEWWIRDGVGGEGDTYVLKEARGYFRRVEVTEGDIWLDVGANIGAFACRAAKKALAVIAVEPAPDNLKILYANIALHNLDNVFVVPMALVGSSSVKTVTLYLNAGKNPGAHSLYASGRGDSVRVLAVDVNRIIKRYGINKMKIDAEGAEVDILFGMDKSAWSEIQALVMEFHFNYLKDKDHGIYTKTLALLHKHFDNVDAMNPNRGLKNWHTTLSASVA
jgi:FkbM family methyltransferase